jgi:putative peptide zinc metalloprotease protein
VPLVIWQALARALSPVEDRPRIAPDLESARFTTRSGAEYVVVHHPRRRAYARLDPLEFDLLPLMDGQHAVKELVIEYFRRHGVLALSRVAGLVRLLRDQGLLEDVPVDSYARLAERLRGPAPSTDMGVASSSRRVDDWFDIVYGRFGQFFFHPLWLWIGLTLGVLGPCLVFWELARGRYALYQSGGPTLLTLAALVALALLALAIHELGHGLGVKHAGRRVHEAGVKLYFGLPAAYVDTSDVWMAPPRERLLTAFAGPWTGLVLGGLCALAAFALPTSTVGAVLFTAAFVFLVDNLFNFNPLLELDGYYMLVDVLDRPLLRPQALAFVGGPLWTRLRERTPLSRDEQLLAAFGIGAIAYAMLTLALAFRAWHALLLPLVLSGWQSGDVWRQLGSTVLVAVIGASLVLALLGLARGLTRRAMWLTRRLGGLAAERRHAEALAALRAVPIWSELPVARLVEIARAMHAEDVPTGAQLVRQGEFGDRFYVVAQGVFEVLIDGQPRLRLARSDYFGERALLRHVRRAATVVAIEPGRVFALSAADFDAFLAGDLALRGRLSESLEYRTEVAEMTLFQDLSPGELDVLLNRLVPIDAARGQTVIEQGDHGERFFIVRSGALEVRRDGVCLARLERGDAFGEIALLLDVPRTASVVAMEPSQLLALDARDFHDVLESYLGRTVALQRLSHLRLRSHRRLDEVA